MSSVGAWVEAALPLPFARTPFLIGILALLAVGTLACWRRRASRASWIAVAISTLLRSRLRPGERHGAAHRLLLLVGSSLRIAKLSLPLSAAQGDWLGAWQHALAANPCAEVAAELTER